MTIIHMAWNPFRDLEKRLKYRFRDKERERSNHATQIAAGGVRPSCPTRHNRIARSGPPHDLVQAITCLDCQGFVTEPEMKDRGYRFDDCPDWIFFGIMDEKAELVHKKGNPVVFARYK